MDDTQAITPDQNLCKKFCFGFQDHWSKTDRYQTLKQAPNIHTGLWNVKQLGTFGSHES